MMAALLGTSMMFTLFEAIQQESNPSTMRLAGLAVLCSTIPFQGIWFVVHAWLVKHDGRLGPEKYLQLRRMLALCELIAYVSIVGLAIILSSVSWILGAALLFSTCGCLIMIRSGRHLGRLPIEL